MTLNLSTLLNKLKFHNKIIIINDNNTIIKLLKFNESYIYYYNIIKNNNIINKGLIDYSKINTLIDINHIKKILYESKSF